MSWPLLRFRLAKLEARSHLTPIQRRSESDKDLRFWTSVGLSLAVLIGVSVILSHGGILTAALAAYGAALGTGGVLGFLFGVPALNKPVNITGHNVAIDTGQSSHAAAGAQPPAAPGPLPSSPAPSSPPVSATMDPAASQSASEPAASTPESANASLASRLSAELRPALSHLPAAAAAGLGAHAASAPPAGLPGGDTSSEPVSAPGSNDKSNLEQVADWVTKLLLGGGLTQITRIPPKIWQWSQTVALGITPPSLDPTLPSTQRLLLANQSFAAGLLVYGFILGFFSGFLITKLQLGKAISD